MTEVFIHFLLYIFTSKYFTDDILPSFTFHRGNTSKTKEPKASAEEKQILESNWTNHQCLTSEWTSQTCLFCVHQVLLLIVKKRLH